MSHILKMDRHPDRLRVSEVALLWSVTRQTAARWITERKPVDDIRAMISGLLYGDRSARTLTRINLGQVDKQMRRDLAAGRADAGQANLGFLCRKLAADMEQIQGWMEFESRRGGGAGAASIRNYSAELTAKRAQLRKIRARMKRLRQ